MSVAVEGNGGNGAPGFSAPRKLFSGLSVSAGTNVATQDLAVSHDGSRIFWLQGIEQPDSNVIHVKTDLAKDRGRQELVRRTKIPGGYGQNG